MKLQFILTSIFVVALSFTQSAFAIDLQSAKNQGLVGEMNTGYLGSPSGSASTEVTSLIRDINTKRKEKFQELANTQGISVNQVSKIFSEKAANKTKPGHYIQSIDGTWSKR
ncbi:MAG: hypothetical protein ACI93R_003625 [Flavobacteriales bacterium]|jgi:uncharacterized protein YdbL (DUF1318 family)